VRLERTRRDGWCWRGSHRIPSEPRRIRWKLVVAALFTAYTAIALADTPLPVLVQNALTPIDEIPTQSQLDLVFAGQALPNLSAIAQDPTGDTGIRLRALHALPKYCVAPCGDSDTAHLTLVGVVNATATARSGSDLLVLRAAVEALGPLRVQTDLALLLPLLTHASRDIRATTALALRDLCNTAALTPLHTAEQQEPSAQVRFAVEDALRVLGTPGACP
jgi:hypothetical protein